MPIERARRPIEMTYRTHGEGLKLDAHPVFRDVRLRLARLGAALGGLGVVPMILVTGKNALEKVPEGEK